MITSSQFCTPELELYNPPLMLTLVSISGSAVSVSGSFNGDFDAPVGKEFYR